MSARSEILGAVRRGLAPHRDETRARAEVAARLAAPARGIVPARSALDHPGVVALFCHWASTLNATVARVSAADVAGAVADYLAGSNLPPAIVMPDSASLARYDWGRRPMLQIRRGLPLDSDRVSLTGAFAGVAETGTLVMVSGPEHPPSLNLLPETHIVLLRQDDIVGSYEEVWERLRARFGKDAMPRTVNTITGPSRTADIEQTLQLGAHGPRRLHILVIED